MYQCDFSAFIGATLGVNSSKIHKGVMPISLLFLLLLTAFYGRFVTDCIDLYYVCSEIKYKALKTFKKANIYNRVISDENISQLPLWVILVLQNLG